MPAWRHFDMVTNLPNEPTNHCWHTFCAYFRICTPRWDFLQARRHSSILWVSSYQYLTAMTTWVTGLHRCVLHVIPRRQTVEAPGVSLPSATVPASSDIECSNGVGVTAMTSCRWHQVLRSREIWASPLVANNRAMWYARHICFSVPERRSEQSTWCVIGTRTYQVCLPPRHDGNSINPVVEGNACPGTACLRLRWTKISLPLRRSSRRLRILDGRTWTAFEIRNGICSSFLTASPRNIKTDWRASEDVYHTKSKHRYSKAHAYSHNQVIIGSVPWPFTSSLCSSKSAHGSCQASHRLGTITVFYRSSHCESQLHLSPPLARFDLLFVLSLDAEYAWSSSKVG